MSRREPIAENGGSVTVLVSVLSGLAAGGALWIAGWHDLADVAWALAVLVALVPLSITVARDLLNRKTGVDLIALLAMLGSLALDQYLAGAVSV